MPLKLDMVLEASTNGRCSYRVRYEIKLEWNPTIASRSQEDGRSHEGEKRKGREGNYDRGKEEGNAKSSCVVHSDRT
jgi:hypothetical protein